MEGGKAAPGFCGEVQPFLECSEVVGLATRAKMEILANPNSKALLQIELAATIDA